MTLLIVLVCLIAIGLIPLGVCAQYSLGNLKAWILIGPIRISIYPRQKKRKNNNADRVSKKSSFDSHAQVKKERNISDYFPILQLVLEFLTDFRCKLRINHLQLKAILAGADPYDLSLNYGRAWAALGNLFPHLERYFIIKKRDLEIECDYVADATRISGRIHMTILVWQILSLGLYHGVKFLRKYLQITRNTKDGAIS